MTRIFIIVLSFLVICAPAHAEDTSCAASDKACLLTELQNVTGQIEEVSWRDTTYREIAKLLVHEKRTDDAIALIKLIKSPDRQAMTIRAIGIEAAQLGYSREEYNALFTALRAEAEKIEHPPSYAIAVNYIADAQALSGDDESSLATAKSLDNAEMRNKALYDSAKIQAEAGRIDAAITGIQTMDDPGFRNKAFYNVSKIRADLADYEGALKLAEFITNDYQKAQSILYLLAKQITPAEVSLVK